MIGEGAMEAGESFLFELLSQVGQTHTIDSRTATVDASRQRVSCGVNDRVGGTWRVERVSA